MARLSVAVMAHRRRAPMVATLLDRLGIDGEHVVWDRKEDRWDTGRRAWLAHDPDATHHLVIQDDAVPALDLLAGLEVLIDRLPQPDLSVLSLYAGNIGKFRRVLGAVTVPDGPCLVQMSKLQWGVAVVLPTAHIARAVETGDRLGRTVPNYDMRISVWAQRAAAPVYYPLPSWVDHADSPSLIAGRGAQRHALRSLSDQSVKDGGPAALPVLRVPDFRRGRQPWS